MSMYVGLGGSLSNIPGIILGIQMYIQRLQKTRRNWSTQRVNQLQSWFYIRIFIATHMLGVQLSRI